MDSANGFTDDIVRATIDYVVKTFPMPMLPFGVALTIKAVDLEDPLSKPGT